MRDAAADMSIRRGPPVHVGLGAAATCSLQSCTWRASRGLMIRSDLLGRISTEECESNKTEGMADKGQ